jgi:hypothetical protein
MVLVPRYAALTFFFPLSQGDFKSVNQGWIVVFEGWMN